MNKTTIKSGEQLEKYDANLYPFKSKRINLEANSVHFVDEGQGEIILFCHPPVSSSFMYRNMIRILSKKFRCIALDFPGFGLSRAAPGYSHNIKSEAHIVDLLIEHLELDPMYLVMQEVGGHAAMCAIMNRPHLLKGIILTDTIIYPVQQYPKISIMLNLVNSAFFNLINSNFNLIIKLLTSSGIKRRKMSTGEKNTYKAMFNTKRIRRTSTRLLYQLFEEKHMLQQIQNAFEKTFNHIPALLIYGENDSLTKMEIPQRIHKLLPNSELHFISGEEHFPHEGAPDEMSKIISGWIEKYNLVLQIED